MRNNHIAYALDAASFLVQKVKRLENIKNIILFGSVSRGEETSTSDVDLFVDILKADKTLEQELLSSLEAFYASTKFKNYWKPLGIENEIKLTIGTLEEWSELKPSIIANGISLYGKYLPPVKEGTHKVFLIWENIKPNAKRVLFNKRLFGFKHRKKWYEGMLKDNAGERLGKGCILVPTEHAQHLISFFRKSHITVKIKRVLEYT